MSEEEYLSADDNINEFNINRKAIAIKNETTVLVELSFYELLNFSDSWSYNRRIDNEKANELYETLCESYDIPWTLHAIYDTTKDIKKILILDGQHRKKAIEKYIEYFNENETCNLKVWVWLYLLDNSETNNSNVAVNLFKKINNNRIFKEDELPNTFVIDLVKQVCSHNILKKGIRNNDANSTAHVPYIHKKELNAIFNENIEYFSGMSIADIVYNMTQINHRISLKNYDNLYGKNVLGCIKKYERAKSIQFFLNLGKMSKYPITKWIKYINNVDKLE